MSQSYLSSSLSEKSSGSSYSYNQQHLPAPASTGAACVKDRVLECWSTDKSGCVDNSPQAYADLTSCLSARGLDAQLFRRGISTRGALKLAATAFNMADQISALQIALDQLERENEKLVETVTKQRDELSNVDSRMNYIIDKHTEEIKLLENLIEDTKPEYEAAQNFGSVIQIEPDQNRNSLSPDDHNLSVRDLRKRVADLSGELTDAIETRERLESRIQELEDDQENLKAASAKLEKDAADKEMELSQLRKHLKELMQKSQPGTTEDNSTIGSADILNELKEENAALDQALMWEREGRAAQIAEYQQEISGLHESMIECKKNYDESLAIKDNEINTLHKLISEQQANLDDVQLQMDVMEDKLSHQLEVALNNVESLTSELDSAKKQLEACHEKIEELEVNAKNLRIDVEGATQRSATVSEKLQRALAEKEDQFQRATKKSEKLQARLNTFLSQSALEEEQRRACAERSSKMTKMIEDKIRHYEIALSAVDGAKAAADKERQDLVTQLAQKQDDYDRLDTQFRRQVSEIQRLSRVNGDLLRKIIDFKKVATDARREHEKQLQQQNLNLRSSQDLERTLNSYKSKVLAAAQQLTQLDNIVQGWRHTSVITHFVSPQPPSESSPWLPSPNEKDESLCRKLSDLRNVLEPYQYDIAKLQVLMSGQQVSGDESQREWATEFGAQVNKRIAQSQAQPVKRRWDLVTFAAEFRREKSGRINGEIDITPKDRKTRDLFTHCLEFVYDTMASEEAPATEETCRSWTCQQVAPVVEHCLNKVIYYDEYAQTAAQALPVIQYSPSSEQHRELTASSQVCRVNGHQVSRIYNKAPPLTTPGLNLYVC